MPQDGLLLHGPFARKPKRIRTAFSPSQLLRLERAFEKNHYVVGAERKQLAGSLSLSETQVIIAPNWRPALTWGAPIEVGAGGYGRGPSPPLAFPGALSCSAQEAARRRTRKASLRAPEGLASQRRRVFIQP